MLKKVGYVLVALMLTVQLLYAAFAYFDPVAFASVRGTELFDSRDTDWVRIYASRTLFVVLMVGFLLYVKNFQLLAAASLLGLVMPVTDAWLAYQASAGTAVILKHAATALFLVATFLVLRAIDRRAWGA